MSINQPKAVYKMCTLSQASIYWVHWGQSTKGILGPKYTIFAHWLKVICSYTYTYILPNKYCAAIQALIQLDSLILKTDICSCFGNLFLVLEPKLRLPPTDYMYYNQSEVTYSKLFNCN